MKKQNPLRLLIWLPVILWMLVIFFLSAQNRTQSGALSEHVTAGFFSLLIQKWNALTVSQKHMIVSIVRKIAHVTEYTVLGGLSMLAFSVTRRKADLRSAAFSCTLGLLYAISDELHQLFVPGRGGMVQDVAIDFVGVLIGTFLMWGLCKLFLKIKKRRLKNA